MPYICNSEPHIPLSFECLLLHHKHLGACGRHIVEVYVGVHSLPCCGMWCTIPHTALIGYGSLPLRMCAMYAQCMSNPQSIGNDEIFHVTASWCITCLMCFLCPMDAVDFL